MAIDMTPKQTSEVLDLLKHWVNLQYHNSGLTLPKPTPSSAAEAQESSPTIWEKWAERQLWRERDELIQLEHRVSDLRERLDRLEQAGRPRRMMLTCPNCGTDYFEDIPVGPNPSGPPSPPWPNVKATEDGTPSPSTSTENMGGRFS